MIVYAQAWAEGFFDDAGYSAGESWVEISFSGFTDSHSYVLEISGDSMEPVFRDGDCVIISPEATIRRGDRVVVNTIGEEIISKVLLRQSARKIDLELMNRAHD